MTETPDASVKDFPVIFGLESKSQRINSELNSDSVNSQLTCQVSKHTGLDSTPNTNIFHPQFKSPMNHELIKKDFEKYQFYLTFQIDIEKYGEKSYSTNEE